MPLFCLGNIILARIFSIEYNRITKSLIEIYKKELISGVFFDY